MSPASSVAEYSPYFIADFPCFLIAVCLRIWTKMLKHIKEWHEWYCRILCLMWRLTPIFKKIRPKQTQIPFPNLKSYPPNWHGPWMFFRMSVACMSSWYIFISHGLSICLTPNMDIMNNEFIQYSTGLHTDDLEYCTGGSWRALTWIACLLPTFGFLCIEFLVYCTLPDEM